MTSSRRAFGRLQAQRPTDLDVSTNAGGPQTVSWDLSLPRTPADRWRWRGPVMTIGLAAVVGFALLVAASREPTATPAPSPADRAAATTTSTATVAPPVLPTPSSAGPTTRPSPVDRAAAQRDEASNQAIDLVEEALFPIEQSAASGRGISYGITDLAHRRLDLWWIGPQPAALRRLVADPGHGVTLVVHPATHTEAALDAAAGRVFTQWKARDSSAHPGYNILNAGFNPATGRIDVGVSTPDNGPVPAEITALVRALDVGFPIGTVTRSEGGALTGRYQPTPTPTTETAHAPVNR